MGKKLRFPQWILITFGILLTLILTTQVLGADLWLSDPTPFPTDYPFPKRTVLVAMEETKVAALKTATPPPGGAIIALGPTPDPIQLGLPPGTPMGDGLLTDGAGMHMNAYMGSFFGNLLVWVTEAEEGKAVLVYAGVYASDPEQGVLYVVREGTIWDGIGEQFEIPTRSGRPEITDAVGKRLIIQTELGDTFYFDVPASKFAPSLQAPLPTRTPGPTPTRWPTPAPLSGDDVTNNPSRAGNRPLNTDLKYKIDPSGDEDWFIFYTTDMETIQISLEDLPAPYQMHVIYADEIQIIGESTEPNTEDKYLLFEDAEPGTYYVNVSGINGSSNSQLTYTLRAADYQFEWLAPLGKNKEYSTKAGNIIPIQFEVNRFDGEALVDETVELSVIDENGATILGPIGYGANPNEGIIINPQGRYHYSLNTKGMDPGTYTLLVTFDEIGGENTLMIHLEKK